MYQIENQLTEEEVRLRLKDDGCNKPEIINELYDFGLTLVEKVSDDIKYLDTKAASMTAYSGATITLLVASFAAWSSIANAYMTSAVVASGIAAFVAAVFSAIAFSLKKFDWFSQDEWLDQSCLKDIRRLKSFRILTMWGVITSYRRAHIKKATLLWKAQLFLGGSMILLLVALFLGVGKYYLDYIFRAANG